LNKEHLDELLGRCVKYHGHFCIGQALGVRIALKGLQLANVGNEKDLIVIVENDRCIADAIQIATGVRLGRRSLKLVNYGKMAATFINMKTGGAFRVNVKKVNCQDLHKEEARRAVLEADESELLMWREVVVNLKPEDMPGKPCRTVNCTICGEKVFDAKDTPGPDGPLCQFCADGGYYSIPK